MEKAVFSRDAFVDCPEAETEEGYQTFLRFVLNYADGFTLCYQGYWNSKTDLDLFCRSRWGYLADSVYDHELTNESPVTIGPQVLMLYFRFDDVTRKFLRERNNIYDFAGDDSAWFWDPAFIKDGKIFFISCTHEGFCTIDEDVLKEFRQVK